MKYPSIEEMKSVRIRTKKEANEYIGSGIFYLRPIDIDHSGRGYYWVRYMHVADVDGNQFLDGLENGIYYRDITHILKETTNER